MTTVHLNRPRGAWQPWRTLGGSGRVRTDCCRQPRPREWVEWRWLDEGLSPYPPIVQWRCKPGHGCTTHYAHRRRRDLHDA